MTSHFVVDHNGTITVDIYYLNGPRIYTLARVRAILENYGSNKCEEDLHRGSSMDIMTEIPRYPDLF